MSLEYAPRGLIGLLTPQANTTAEPELALLWPKGVAMICARLVSDKPSMNDRLVDYFHGFDAAVRQFANAPIQAVAAACTGASYLAGRDRESAMVERIMADRGVPFVTAALAIADAVRALGARRLGLVSPYPGDLERESLTYWRSHSFEIVDIAHVASSTDAFHPIYALESSRAGEALRRLAAKPLDAIVMLGTGMPTLRPIADLIGSDAPPVLSSNLCLAWRSMEAINRETAPGSTLTGWLRGEGWRERVQELAQGDR
jgi:maleate cis-trans isomerase